MHIVFVHFHFLIHNQRNNIYNNIIDNNIKVSIIQRSNNNFTDGNKYYVKDEFEQELRWWQNPELLNEHISQLKPDLVYIYGLNLPLHFRWLRHYLATNTIIIAQYCGEDIWIQKNLWLQQFGLRVVNGFVFATKKDANSWRKCAAILDSQPVFELKEFKNEITDIYNRLLINKRVSD
jgi:hypothetical protein